MSAKHFIYRSNSIRVGIDFLGNLNFQRHRSQEPRDICYSTVYDGTSTTVIAKRDDIRQAAHADAIQHQNLQVGVRKPSR